MCILQVLLENPELTLRSHSMSARSTSARIRSTGDMDLSLHEEKAANYVVQVSGNPLRDEESSAEELSLNAESCKYVAYMLTEFHIVWTYVCMDYVSFVLKQYWSEFCRRRR